MWPITDLLRRFESEPTNEYVCSKCDTRFPVQYHVCPRCNSFSVEPIGDHTADSAGSVDAAGPDDSADSADSRTPSSDG